MGVVYREMIEDLERNEIFTHMGKYNDVSVLNFILLFLVCVRMHIDSSAK